MRARFVPQAFCRRPIEGGESRRADANNNAFLMTQGVWRVSAKIIWHAPERWAEKALWLCGVVNVDIGMR